MSDTQFTPGPWLTIIHPSSSAFRHMSIMSGPVRIAGHFIRTDIARKQDPGVISFDANALLIAAAPDMHADLSTAPILSDFNTSRGFNQAKFVAAYQDWKRNVARTLAKANGQETAS